MTPIRAPFYLCTIFVLLCSGTFGGDSPFRPPSVPLVIHDPYFSIWSPADRLTDAETVHWTGQAHPLRLVIRLDGAPFRLMGTEPAAIPAMAQTALEVGPLTTKYTFRHEKGEFCLEFTTPLLPSDLDLLSRPATSVRLAFKSNSDARHRVEIYFDAGAELAVHTKDQRVGPAELMDVPGTKTLKIGSKEQVLFGRRGDDIRIDWGHLIVSARESDSLVSVAFRNGAEARNEFAFSGTPFDELPIGDFYGFDESHPVLAATWKMDDVSSFALPLLILAYDDIYSIKYFKDLLRAWWRRNDVTTENMIRQSWTDIEKGDLLDRCRVFERDFFRDFAGVGGRNYAKLCALAYRQAFGAQKIVADRSGMPLMFSKENHSNGSIGTVDVMYPCSPMLLYYSPMLTKASLQPILDYAASPRWRFPYAPHDLGTYPYATGQTYGGGEVSEERQMPVEESANMLIQLAALAFVEGNSDYASRHFPLLTRWADYLVEKGFDPENQLCTDDFAGHLAHNVNLSAKAIIGIASYAMLADMAGKKEEAGRYRKIAETFVSQWIAEGTQGGHTKLTFDKPDTWSMKYNLMWDELLQLRLFPRETIDREIVFYKTKNNRYGLPLDSRSLYTKSDWILWIATMTKTPEDFHELVDPVIAFVNETPQRVPLSDWYFTDSAKIRGFQARSVVGGFFAPMLKDTERWKSQAAQGANVSGDWSTIPIF